MRTLQACRSAVASFDPTSISGCKLWLDASDASSFTYSSGVVVSQWNDLSGEGNHVAQSTGAQQPSRNGTQNGLDTVAFDGSDFMKKAPATFIGPSSVTIISVFKKTGAASDDGFPCGLQGTVATGTENQGRPLTGYNAYRRIISGFWTYSARNIATSTSWGVIASKARIAGADTKFVEYYNGALVEAESTIVNGAANWPSSIQIVAVGNSDGLGVEFTGEIAEVLIYESLADADREDVEAYLIDKWGI